MSDMKLDANQLMAEMRRLSAIAEGQQTKLSGAPAEETGTEFSALLKQSIDAVNNVQQDAGRLQEAFERGDPDVSLAKVMIANQKAGVAFQAMVQVRNRLVQAYQDVMSMQV